MVKVANADNPKTANMNIADSTNDNLIFLIISSTSVGNEILK